MATCAWGQTASISAPNIGKVVAGATGVTTFRFASSTGNVTITGPGTGYRLTTPTARFTVTIPCINNNYCKNSNMKVVVTALGGTAGSRAKTLTNLTFTNSTATMVSNPTQPASSLTFTIGAIGNNNTVSFFLGGDLPIDGDDQTSETTGALTSAIQVTTSQTNGNGAINSGGSVGVTVDRGLKITENPAINFGRIFVPTGAASVSLPASSGPTGARSLTGTGGLASPTPRVGNYTITGEGGQLFSLSVQTSFNLSNGTTTIPVTTSTTGQGTQILSGSSGSAGSYGPFYVGGSFSLDQTTSQGAYSGTFLITASYN